MYILMSAVASIVATVGSFTFRTKNGHEKVTLVVQHPDQCYLIEPNPISNVSAPGADIVLVEKGNRTFRFDCDGKQLAVDKDVEPGDNIWRIDPRE